MKVRTNMKKASLSLLIFGLGFGLAASAFAEEYYAPIKKELEPLARIPMPEYTMTDSTLNYKLPRDLTGREISIDLSRDTSIPGDLPRIFRGDKATVACMGSNDLPACVVTHKNLGIDKNEVSDFLRNKYRDPKKLMDAISVAETFSAGNEPIGIISKRTNLPFKELPKLWAVEILLNAEGNQSVSTVANVNLNLESLHFAAPAAGEWPLSDLGIDENHIAADYVRANQKHWMDINVSTDKTRFEGTWGFYGSDGKPAQASGLLKGKAK